MTTESSLDAPTSSAVVFDSTQFEFDDEID
jgi:hypothetical protein